MEIKDLRPGDRVWVRGEFARFLNFYAWRWIRPSFHDNGDFKAAGHFRRVRCSDGDYAKIRFGQDKEIWIGKSYLVPSATTALIHAYRAGQL